MASAQVQAVPVESNQMSLAFERQAYDPKYGGSSRIPCTLVTGFLGSGKTTLVQHIQRHRGDLRIAVLVNEFGEVDIDSILLQQTNSCAALGIPNVRLANGCACCTVSNDLRSAVKAVMGGPHHFDHLLLETSGLADPRPIAALLEDIGVHLDRVVTVVDAESLPAILSVPVAKRQLALADIILINKCDLATLGQIADVEDIVESETGGRARAVRTRFSRVPLGLVLDVMPAVTPPPLTTTSANSQEGILSHEATTFGSTQVLPQRRQNGTGQSSGERNSEEEAERGAGGRGGKGQNERLLRWKDSIGSHACSLNLHEENGFVSLAVTLDQPLSMAAFQDFVLWHIRAAKGLLRVKGLLWFQERRRMRYVFHFSGKQRCEATCDGQWESPPACQLVLIGRDRAELERLQSSLMKTISSIETESDLPCGSETKPAKGGSHATGGDHSTGGDHRTGGDHATGGGGPLDGTGSESASRVTCGDDLAEEMRGDGSTPFAAALELETFAQKDERFKSVSLLRRGELRGGTKKLPRGTLLEKLPDGTSPAEVLPGGTPAKKLPGGAATEELQCGTQIKMLPGGVVVDELPGGAPIEELPGGSSPAEELLGGVWPVVVFGLKGLPLKGIMEAPLNACLMREVNKRGKQFLSSATTAREGGLLQLAFGQPNDSARAWEEIKVVAKMVLAKTFKDVCPCRNDMTPAMLESHKHHCH